MSRIISTVGLAEALKAEGFPLPAECREARVIFGIDAAYMIQYDVFLTLDDLAALGRALQRISMDAEK